ncbi:hypothetical protein FGO68_gene17073 [Halteria grandinella]|uniref:Uncharacterized protein n=1 Tax=Halteria grandinella TaxID=5974 RepID=A0A8J8T2Q2_HALGN|nr:hypothetical protein FGO68_gene17073 [Halteria grandinella]
MINDYRQCTHAFNGLSMITLSSMLYGQLTFKLSDKASSIEHLEADVNFRHSFDNCYQNFKYFLKQMQLRMASIGTITICKLTDYESVLSFEIIYLLLLSVAQLEYTHKFPPIELRVAKFSYRSDKYDPEFSKMKISDTLSAYMGEMKLDITSIEENMDRKKVIIRMRLSNQIAREMKLIVDRSKEGSIFEIANAESQDNSAKAINIQRNFQIQRQEIS